MDGGALIAALLQGAGCRGDNGGACRPVSCGQAWGQGLGHEATVALHNLRCAQELSLWLQKGTERGKGVPRKRLTTAGLWQQVETSPALESASSRHTGRQRGSQNGG